LLTGFVAAVLVGALAAVGMVHWGLAKIDQTIVTGLVSDRTAVQAEPVANTPQPRLLNVLLVGSDSREGMSAEDRRAFGTGDFEGSRTDTIMLLQVELDGDGRAAVLSFPRDLLVTRCDSSRGRINAAYTVGIERDGDGPSCLVETVSDLTGVKINHYVEVSFAGFLKVVDALGGVGLYLDEPLYDEKAHLDLPAGCVQLQGADALGFVRARHLDDDFGRIARQQRFIKEMLREATDMGVLTNPRQLYRIVDAAAAAVQTDDGLGLAQMREIAGGLRNLTSSGLEVYTVPSAPILSNGTAYVVEDAKAAKRLYASFRDGSVVTAGPPPQPEDTKPALPPVTVLNGVDKDGLAASAAELLEAKGYVVAEVGDAEIGGLERTRILHGPELAAAAAQLAKLFPEADVIEGVEGLPLTLKLGANDDPAQIAARIGRSDKDRASRSGGEASTERESGQANEAAQTEPTYRGAGSTDVDC
jgi:LCP family protein required for cell wall assembly